ncbi:MAG: type IV pilus assembly protein PilA [Francisella sp.]|jgi:type IV pilus assembly protein PilA
MKKLQTQMQKGFSLVELMVVIAIIAILAAVAIPMYSNYTTKAKISASLAGLGGLKTTIAEENTAVAVSGSTATVLTGVNEVAVDTAVERNGTSFTTQVTAATGDITLTYTLPVIGVIKLIPTIGTNTINWACTATGTGLSSSNVPSNCSYS